MALSRLAGHEFRIASDQALSIVDALLSDAKSTRQSIDETIATLLGHRDTSTQSRQSPAQCFVGCIESSAFQKSEDKGYGQESYQISSSRAPHLMELGQQV